MKLLLDTSIIIDFLRQKDKEKTIYITLTKAGYSLFISIITHAELYSGKSIWEDEEFNQALETIFSGLTILSLDLELSKAAGKIRAYHKIELNDAIIAATAIENGCELVTLNVKDFEKIPHLKLFSEK